MSAGTSLNTFQSITKRRFKFAKASATCDRNLKCHSVRRSPQPGWFVAATLVLTIATGCLVEAGFWTFYFPNILKATGYDELTTKIGYQEKRINTVKDNFADIQYFFGLLQEVDSIDPDSLYPEESACSELFPMFRDLAIEYIYIDYNNYIEPLERYLEHLYDSRSKWFPLGTESKATLPREWEQRLYEREMELKIEWHTQLTERDDYKEKRQKLLDIWKTAKRSLDSSLQCIYLRQAYRQIAEDINQLSLETNLRGMHAAMEMIKSAYKRIEKFKRSDLKAMEKIAWEAKKDELFKIEH